MEVFIVFLSLIVLVTISVPVGLSIGGATIIALLLFSDVDIIVLTQYCVTGIDSFSLLAIPFFILAGTIMSLGGIAKRLVDLAASFLGSITGGLGAVVAVASMFFGALSGSSLATVSAIGSIMVPEMKRKGYDAGYSAVLTACAGTIGAVIPPSIPLVIYGCVTGTSVGDLFLAGIVPGILIGVGLIIGNYFVCRKKGYPLEARGTIKGILKSTWDAKWALMAPFIILGGIYSGIFTPTEAAVVAVVYSIIVSVFIYKELDFKGLYQAFVTTAVVNGITSFLLGISTGFAAYLSIAQVPRELTVWLTDITDNKYIFLFIINIALLIIGCVIDNIPATLILAPMLLPVMLAYGVDPVHFGIFMTVNLLIGLVTPPYGCSLFVASAVCHVRMEEMLKNIAVPLITLIICLMLITYIPQISLFLVK